MKKIAPHTFFFLLISILYGLPTILTFFFHINSNQVYVSNILKHYQSTKYSFLVIYLIAIFSFLLGTSISYSILKNQRKNKTKISLVHYSKLSLGFFQKNFIYFIIILSFGVIFNMYRQGFFSSSYMDSFNIAYGSRNFFSVLSDIAFFLFIYLTIYFKDQYRLYKIILFFIISITLLVGSRMFIVPLLLYFILREIFLKNKSGKRILVITFIGVLSVFGLMSIFLLRHGIKHSGIDLFILLIQYESIGVNVPLMKEILLDWHNSISPTFIFYFSDILLFTIPRFLFPEKNSFLYFDNQMSEYYLSPFGGTNGEASVVLYFGIFYPLFFFILGAIFSTLFYYAFIKGNNKIKVFYIYLCCSFMFTFLRNGILNATKTAIIIYLILTFLIFLKRLVIKVNENSIYNSRTCK